MSAARIPRQVAEYRLEAIDDDLLLYHPGQTKAIHLNETAKLIWQLCDGHRTEHEIAGLLRDAFPEEASRVVADVTATLARLADEGAIEFA